MHKKLSDQEYVKYTKALVSTAKKLPYDDGPPREGWGDLVGRHRDSDILEVSNFEVIEADLTKRFPDDVETASFGHFAVGWVEELLVRVLDKHGKITPAGKAAVDWGLKLESYPVADEDDFSRREFEAEEEAKEAESKEDVD